MMKKNMSGRVNCEVCSNRGGGGGGAEAYVYCAADNAYLCWSCDGQVHGANFLAARHLRQILCFHCQASTGFCISGFCSISSISIDDHDAVHYSSCCSSSSSSSLSSSAACVSTTTQASSSSSSCATSHDDDDDDHQDKSSSTTNCIVTSSSTGRKRDHNNTMAESVLVNWRARLNGPDHHHHHHHHHHHLHSLAAALWFACTRHLCHHLIRRQSSSSSLIKELQHITGVPAQLISAAESGLQRALKRRRRNQFPAESWDESSSSSS